MPSSFQALALRGASRTAALNSLSAVLKSRWRKALNPRSSEPDTNEKAAKENAAIVAETTARMPMRVRNPGAPCPQGNRVIRSIAVSWEQSPMLLAVVPMMVCGQCHPEIVARFTKTPMAITSGLVEPSSEPVGGFFHKASGAHFEIVKSGNRLEVDWNGNHQPLDFFIGSRRMGRSYGFAEDGY